MGGARAARRRPNPDTSANYSGRFHVEARRRSKPKPVPTEPPLIVKLLASAEAWQADLDAGRVKKLGGAGATGRDVHRAGHADSSVARTGSEHPGVDPGAATGDASAVRRGEAIAEDRAAAARSAAD